MNQKEVTVGSSKGFIGLVYINYISISDDNYTQADMGRSSYRDAVNLSIDQVRRQNIFTDAEIKSLHQMLYSKNEEDQNLAIYLIDTRLVNNGINIRSDWPPL